MGHSISHGPFDEKLAYEGSQGDKSSVRSYSEVDDDEASSGKSIHSS